MRSTSRSVNQVNRQSAKLLAEALGPDMQKALKQGVKEYLRDLLLVVANGLMEEEVTQLCGKMHERNPDRKFTRHGYQQGVVKGLDASKVAIERPRVRNVKTNKEAELKTYEKLNDRALLDEEAMAQVSAGVSERAFSKMLNKTQKTKSSSQSTISRRVVRNLQQSLEAFEQRRWEKVRFQALLFDGVRIGKVLAIACVGIDLSGRKHVLAAHPGATESEIVCRDLIRKLVERGLNVEGNYLFVVDGSKALRAAILQTFGNQSVFQRCQEHKIRDVQAYVPYRDREQLRVKMQAAYNSRSYKEASIRLQEIRSKLATTSDQAVRSMTEGLEDTLTLHRLGIFGGLKDSLRTTNIIESAFSGLRRITKNVTNWQNETQVNGWMAHALLDSETRFRRVQGHRALTRLRKKLDAHYTASQTI